MFQDITRATKAIVGGDIFIKSPILGKRIRKAFALVMDFLNFDAKEEDNDAIAQLFYAYDLLFTLHIPLTSNKLSKIMLGKAFLFCSQRA